MPNTPAQIGAGCSMYLLDSTDKLQTPEQSIERMAFVASCFSLMGYNNTKNDPKAQSEINDHK
jgi:hypothetical protein